MRYVIIQGLSHCVWRYTLTQHTLTHTHASEDRKMYPNSWHWNYLREGAVFCSRNYLDNSLRIWIQKKSRKLKEIAGLLCIKMRQNGGGDWTKQRGPGLWPRPSTGVRGGGATEDLGLWASNMRHKAAALFAMRNLSVFEESILHDSFIIKIPDTNVAQWSQVAQAEGGGTFLGPAACHHLTEVMVSQVCVPVSLYSYKSICQNSSVGTLQTCRFLYVNYTFKS